MSASLTAPRPLPALLLPDPSWGSRAPRPQIRTSALLRTPYHQHLKYLKWSCGRAARQRLISHILTISQASGLAFLGKQ